LGSGSNYCFSVFEWHVHATAGRSPLTAYGNARVGPPIMSFVHSIFSPTAFMRLEGINNFDRRNRSKTVKLLQADSEGVFFSSESAEKKHTGRVD
jgi:hypothetical protein